ncbi:MAG: FAD-dependent oxidoreductase [Desulfofustis sp.]|nr:FAD-dependent oxidoreductase [Desulfofustis sp.]
MKKRLVVAGGGHAHMMLLARIGDFIERGCEVTVVGPSEHHYYSGMGPGLLGGTYQPEEVRFATRLVTEKLGGKFVEAKVQAIDPDRQLVSLDNGEQISYDLLSCNLGSQVPQQMVDGPLDDIFLVKPIERLLGAQQRILELGISKTVKIGVVGGGPSAVEIGGNIWQLGQTPGMKPVEVTIFAGRKLMPDHPEGVRGRAIRSLQQRHITILEGTRVTSVQTGKIMADDGTEYECDLIFIAVGVNPSRVFDDSGIACGPDGGMSVNRYLQSVTHDNIFGGGDCIHFADQPLDKVGVYAVRQNPILVHNLLATITDQPLKPFEPGGSYLLIFNLGNQSGILYKWSILFGGRLAFMIKDYIDRKFMRTFQALEAA